MAVENDVQDVVSKHLIVVEGDDVDGETPPADPPEPGEGDDDHVVISIGDAAPAPEDEEVAKAPEWVKELRKIDREKSREIRELKQKLEAAAAPAAVKPAEVVKRPTLADCDYDEEAFEAKFAAWNEQQESVKAAQREQERAAQKEKDDWQARMDAHSKAKAALKVPDYEDAEEVAKDIFNVTQQGIIVSGSDNSANVIYALGKNPAKAKELASIKDPVKFAFAVAKLETQLKVTTRKAPPAPERQVRGNTSVAIGAGDAELERLRADADKTGDMSKVMAYKAQKKRAA
ncbi:MAG: hypothetical protein V4641_31325 [Pseudomonadota bacterium]